MAKLKDNEYPIDYPNGNVTFTEFDSENFDYKFKAKALSSFSPRGDDFGLTISRQSVKKEVADIALDFNDAIALRDALNLYIERNKK